ncbi:polar amino acid ABC transporter permease [Pacificitalea manganoxidans]|uniref:Polar amino acid ABC transporter permease n=1 Tax=Pacificitalea manganoxidans TaxID=1411902 RepID=A0A291LXI9_9RHOB|nr:ABC transporter permease subunit [Pacificitalea manganoxidans]MAQ44642.1 polar amino acid ABC transporter permease [Actibacterium sp.]OWU71359.1 polar amino acid ABC transporter permease [Roseovarius sp. 22II1-1F6A]ATI41374.1 polar amino acid ABC transporter permease [Pacificitalea manganoxidans]MBF54427.1 polar amino acid ABC transporter permease [Actibacterium sp.]MDR6308783.1 polar amino acid transport system permease protein [Pacificitalea manganoxidans]|tara:strand:+ start:958 stop:1626 length:669 start_codon:yes stop_codon:yes gene_type:complete
MRFLETFFNPAVIAKYTPALIEALFTTIWLSVIIVLSGLLLGAVLACLRAFRVRVLSALIVLFADFFRAIPPLVAILILYFGMPSVGVVLSDWVVLYLVLGLVLAAFSEEIFWAGLTAVHKGQWEAGRATGLSFVRVLVEIAFPQAWRMGIPPLVNRALAITKMTALGSVIGVKEILSVSASAQSFSGSATPLTMAAVAYMIIFIPAVIASRMIERRFHYAT